MSDVSASRATKTPEDWWSTSIIDMKPGEIRYRGYAIEELIGRIGFADMVYLMTRGELPHPDAAKLLEAALVSAVDHGPQAPSIAAARMAITCGSASTMPWPRPSTCSATCMAAPASNVSRFTMRSRR